MSKLLKSKILLGVMIVAVMFVGFAVVNTVSADDTCTVTAPLKLGSSGAQVMCLQSKIGAVADGAFGPMTHAKVMAFQASNGLVADGVVGPATRAALMNVQLGNPNPTGDLCPNGMTMASNCTLPPGGTPTVTLCPNGMTLASNCTVSPNGTPNTGTLTGGAGEVDYTSTTTGLESSVKEGGTEKVLATKLEADGSDVSVTSVKISFENNSGNGSTRLEKYLDKVTVMLGSTEVGSVDADEFSKDGDIYSKSIALSNAVIQEGEKETLSVSVEALGTVDDETADFDGIITQVRWMDATGAIFSDSDSDGSDFGTGAVQTFGFDEANVDDSLEVKSSSTNPDDATITVDDGDTTDDVLALAFKLDVDEDSADVTVNDIMFTVDVSNFDATGNGTVDASDDIDVSAAGQWADRIISEVNVKVGSETYEADLDDNVTTAQDVADGVGTLTYTVDFDEEFVVESGDDVTVEVMVTFAEQDDADYNEGVVVQVSLADEDTDITAETENDELTSAEIDGSAQTGAELTLSLSNANVTSISWVASGGGAAAGSLDFFFTVEATDGDIDVTDDAIDAVDTLTVTGTAAIAGAVVTLVSGDASGATDAYTVADGDEARFRVRYNVTGSAGSAEVKLTEIVGQPVPDDKQLSPTIYLE